MTPEEKMQEYRKCSNLLAAVDRLLEIVDKQTALIQRLDENNSPSKLDAQHIDEIRQFAATERQRLNLEYNEAYIEIENAKLNPE
jgi:hypothetical protein